MGPPHEGAAPRTGDTKPTPACPAQPACQLLLSRVALTAEVPFGPGEPEASAQQNSHVGAEAMSTNHVPAEEPTIGAREEPVSPHELWQRALQQLELQLTQNTFNTWLRATEGLAMDDGMLTVSVPNNYARDWLGKRLLPTIQETLQRLTGRDVACAFVVRQATARPGRPAPLFEGTDDGESADLPPVRGSQPLNRKYTFDSFVVGAGNRLAHAAAQAVAERANSRYNPLFIYGGAGLGKTHLLHAIGHAARARGAQVILVSSERFTNDLIESIRRDTTESFRAAYRCGSMLLMDDVHFLAGKERTQEEFFHTFNAIHDADGQLVLTSDRLPQAIATLEDRLRSRFQWGLLVDIQPPDLETRIAILRAKAERRGQQLPDDVIELIAQAVEQNIRELEGALNRVLMYANCNQLPLDAATARLALAELIVHREPPSLQRVLEVVASHYRISVEDLTGRRRSARIAEPRQVAMYLMREEASASYPAIGAILGQRDHTTALHGCEKIAHLLEQDSKLRRDVLHIREKLYAEAPKR